ncbi:MAG: AMP-binding protein, partial [Chloroflexi bacterium]|nr:AMP-binding protein [Chloroflexota bacterium]
MQMNNDRKLSRFSDDELALLDLLLDEAGEATPATTIPRRANADAPPLSFAQERLWFIEQLTPGSPAYTIPLALRLVGPLDLAALERSLNTIVSRHAVLRTTFAQGNDGQPVQVIADSLAITLSMIDLQHLSRNDQEAELQRIVPAAFGQPFDLAAGPLLRAQLIKFEPAEHILLVTLHHIIADGWSRDVLVREAATLYTAFATNQSPQLPELSIQYADYAVWQRDRLQGELLETQIGYWKQQLANAPAALDLPLDRPRPPIQTFNGASTTFALPAPLSQALDDLSRRENCTLFMTLLAAWQVLLHRYSGQRDILVGTPIAGRTHAELEDLIGFFINTLVLRGDVGGDPSFRELLARARETTLAAYAHQDVPFEKLVEELQPTRDLSRSPFFQVMFALQNAPVSEINLPELRLHALGSGTHTAKFDLTLFMEQTPHGLIGAVEYNTDLFDPSTIDGMIEHFATLLAGIVANPDQRISRLPLISARELEFILRDWNDTAATYPQNQGIHELFAAQAAQTPDAIAAVFLPSDGGDTPQLTYAELNARANQLAHHLRGLGVEPETRVGVCMERSLDLLVGILGILKAGGAYVPLDPAYPRERLQFMIEDAQMAVLLTQARLLQNEHNQLPALHDNQGPTVVCLDADWPTIAESSAHNPQPSATDENLAYVIYTSGSTGVPKGV